MAYNLKESVDNLFRRVSNHIDTARGVIQRTIDTEMVKAYWKIGRDIVEEEQQGLTRAAYGSALLQEISARLTKVYGRGFSVTTLKYSRLFYLEYQAIAKKHPIRHTVCDESGVPAFSPKLGWSHYRCLMRVQRIEARLFYEQEAINNCWSVRELQRQISTLLFDRLARTKDKQGLMELVYRGQQINNPSDAIKEPLVLEFLDIPESHHLTELKVETALIDNLQEFLLELGKGFAFVARQKRLSFDSQYYYADLVFYHIILKCYVIIDLKTHMLTHADLGQMQLYVNYFDKEIKQVNDNPTIGILLCADKSDEMVKYQLGEQAKQIFASKYQFHFPSDEELLAVLKKQSELLEEQIQQQ